MNFYVSLLAVTASAIKLNMSPANEDALEQAITLIQSVLDNQNGSNAQDEEQVDLTPEELAKYEGQCESAKKQFHSYDQNNDDLLDLTDWELSYKFQNDRYISNGSESISYDEFMVKCEQSEAKCQDKFERMDADHSGVIDETDAVLLAQEKNAVLLGLDSNGDGKLTVEEYARHACGKLPENQAGY